MLEIFQELVNLVSKGESCVLATVISSNGATPRKVGAKMLIKKDGTFIGTIGGGQIEKSVLEKAAAVIQTGIPETIHFDLAGTGRKAAMICGGQTDIYLEAFRAAETLYLFGAGHISQVTAVMGKMLGFRVVVIDPRPEFNNEKRFPGADQLVVKDYPRAFKELKVGKDDYIVIFTPGHLNDEKCLAFAVKTKAKYIGMIGSKKKALEIKQRIVDGGTPQRKVDEVHTPIGIEIGAETPEEIAVSILAEIIKVRQGTK